MTFLIQDLTSLESSDVELKRQKLHNNFSRTPRKREVRSQIAGKINDNKE